MTHTNHALPSRRRHASNFSDAVVAAYIHDISARHSQPRERGGSMPARSRGSSRASGSYPPPAAAEASTASIRSASSARSAL